ncbi:hypothetical protein CLV56_0155 [Mumia flava]|uniref:Uncharacterized protein n=1 Tax=Mumia flava TaxID=1348852 RepID=A0A0B2BDS2_9ACTN|nr:hypothetical protein [Mumia flava]PJJ55952.1 hypothetical protein CLV56_0155 [Mumia flava]
MVSAPRGPVPDLPDLDPITASSLARDLVGERSARCGHGKADPRFRLLAVGEGGRIADVGWWDAPEPAALTVDDELRRQVVLRLTSGSGDDPRAYIGVWERHGDLQPTTSDAAWWSAVRTVVSSPSALLVVTRYGWRAWPDGPQRQWARVRPRS